MDKSRVILNTPFWAVAAWEVIDNEVRILEIIYVGSREDAPY